VPTKHLERKKFIDKQKLPQTTREEGSIRLPSSNPSEEKSPERERLF
jgi:hypothetical protein